MHEIKAHKHLYPPQTPSQMLAVISLVPIAYTRSLRLNCPTNYGMSTSLRVTTWWHHHTPEASSKKKKKKKKSDADFYWEYHSSPVKRKQPSFTKALTFCMPHLLVFTQHTKPWPQGY